VSSSPTSCESTDVAGSLADLEAAARGAIAAHLSWTCKVEAVGPFNVKVEIVADRGTDPATMLSVQAAVKMALDEVRPAGCTCDVEVTAEPEPDSSGEVDDFVAQMRALRGDYGVCAHCGDRFGEREATTTDPRGRVHPKCVFVGTCAGCAKPVVKSDHSTLMFGTRTHTDCVEQALDLDRQRKEREARAAARGQAAHAKMRVIDGAIAHARQGYLVALVVRDREVETVATGIVHGYSNGRPRGKLAANLPGRKAVAWPDTTGMVIVESADRASLAEAGGGYVRAYLTRGAMDESPGLPAFVASCFHLSPGQVLEEEIER
jgi:hypothetical protein